MRFCHAMRINDTDMTLDLDLHPRVAARYSRESGRPSNAAHRYGPLWRRILFQRSPCINQE